jgi:hypothetical protein
MSQIKPVEWDCFVNLIFMQPVTGPPHFDGTLGIASFTPPADGDYLVVINFTGNQTTMNLTLDGVQASAFTANTSDPGAVIALRTGKAGTAMQLELSSAGQPSPDNPSFGVAHLESVQVFKMS